MALNDTIDELVRQRAARRGTPPVEADAKVEWSNDVDAVMDLIRKTLARFVEAGSASLSSDLIDVSEELIGTYPVQRLTIDIAGLKILVEPIARYTFGGAGRIDMYREARPSEDDRLLILRPVGGLESGRASWLIETRKMFSLTEFVERGGVERGVRRYLPLDRTGIEGALDFLLTMG